MGTGEQYVLVVDGDSLIRWCLGERLSESGYRVLRASTIRGALPLAEKAHLVLLEHALPDGNGEALAVELKGRRPRLPLVVTTVYCTPELERLVRTGAVDAVIEKPFALDDMLDLVRSYLPEDRDAAGPHPAPT